jgi:hypothetical protein
MSWGKGRSKAVWRQRNPEFRANVDPQKLINQLTPWNRVLLENVAGSQLVKKFPACYGT